MLLITELTLDKHSGMGGSRVVNDDGEYVFREYIAVLSSNGMTFSLMLW